MFLSIFSTYVVCFFKPFIPWSFLRLSCQLVCVEYLILFWNTQSTGSVVQVISLGPLYIPLNTGGGVFIRKLPRRAPPSGFPVSHHLQL